MAEQTNLLLRNLPIRLRPQRRQFITPKSGLHADWRVVSRDRIAARQPQQMRQIKWQQRSPRLACHYGLRFVRHQPQQLFQSRAFKMMQKQVRHRRLRVVLLQPVKHIRCSDLDCPTYALKISLQRIARRRTSIHQNKMTAAPSLRQARRHPQGKYSVSGAQFHNALRRAARKGGEQCLRDERWLPKERVQSPQIAPRINRLPRVRGKRIQPLGRQCPVHGPTSKIAPWQLNPAPNEDSHHFPPVAPSRNARCNANITHGLLMFPCSSSTSALHRKSSGRNPRFCCNALKISRPPACIIHWVNAVWSKPIPPATWSKTTFAWRPVTSGTSGAKILRSKPPFISKRSNSRCFGASSEPLAVHLTCRFAPGLSERTAAPAPSPKRHALINTPGSSSR